MARVQVVKRKLSLRRTARKYPSPFLLSFRIAYSDFTSYDPAFLPPGIRYSMPPLFPPDESWEVDERGNVDWAGQWRKELNNLLHVTEQQDKAGAEQEWYRQMLVRVRTGMMTPVMNPAELGQAPHGMPGAPAERVGEVAEH